jgi:hypothetical protein
MSIQILPPWIKAQRRAKMFGSLTEQKRTLFDEINSPLTGKNTSQ